jgi:hypothetical protein
MRGQGLVPPRWLVVIAFAAGTLCALSALAFSIYWYGRFDRPGVLLYIFAPGFSFILGLCLVLGPYQVYRRIRR